MILDNYRITIREVADDVGISFGSCQVILTNVLGIKHASVKIVPKLLNFEQKQHRMDILEISGDIDYVQRQSRFAQKAHNW